MTGGRERRTAESWEARSRGGRHGEPPGGAQAHKRNLAPGMGGILEAKGAVYTGGEVQGG